MSELNSLILTLRIYQPFGQIARPKALGFILDFKRFIYTLENINNMIGLNYIKNQIAHQVQSFIVNYHRFGKPTYKQKLHVLLYGPSGCGKTQIGEYLAEFWACSGCLPTEGKADVLFQSKTDPVVPKLNLQSDKIDAEKLSLRQNLAVQSAQLRNCQQRIQNTTTIISNVLTQFNNVRKKVKSKIPNNEEQIQAKFQEIKKDLKEVAGKTVVNNDSSSVPNSPQILPVIVPKFPGVRSIFGNSQPPLLPHIPNDTMAQLASLFTSPLKPTVEIIKKEEEYKPIGKFIRITKGDLVGKFQGHTTDQVRKLLLEYVGGVIMIDEAYSLCTSSSDDFGKEILTEIINFMNTWPDKIIFIFAGYRAEMEATIMKFQPGLARRFGWTFEIKEYTSEDLNLIFQQQLTTRFAGSLQFSEDTKSKLEKFFKDNASHFHHYGGDTERLCDIVKETFNRQNWNSALDDTISKEDYSKLFLNVEFDCINTSFDKYLENSVRAREETNKLEQKEKDKRTFGHMYS
jgi:hypothetical protein